MRKIIETQDDGFEALMGRQVAFFCCRYIYWGMLTGVNDTHVEIKDAFIVYETGSFDSRTWKDAQKVSDTYYIMKSAIESFGVMEKSV